MPMSMLTSIIPPKVGHLPEGPLNSLTDVKPVLVGQVTLAQEEIQTGVTVITPHQKNLFTHKVAAGVSIFNGFGKSMGLMQLKELGCLETPIALSNTFAVPILAQAQIKSAFKQNPKIGREWATVNPLVLECNDGYLNDIQALAIEEAHYFQALDKINSSVEQGSVGAGRGMQCFSLKGGIGTASRVVMLNNNQEEPPHYTVGALVLANFGSLPYLQIKDKFYGKAILKLDEGPLPKKDQGSIIMIIATDAPLDSRQLRRLSQRASVGLARTGSNMGHGSGDIALAFSTTTQISQEKAEHSPTSTLHETDLNPLFDATAEAVEQAIINALYYATYVQGFRGNECYSLPYWIKKLKK